MISSWDMLKYSLKKVKRSYTTVKIEHAYAPLQVLPLPGAWRFLFPCRHLEPQCVVSPRSSSQHTHTAELHDRWTLRTETNHNLWWFYECIWRLYTDGGMSFLLTLEVAATGIPKNLSWLHSYRKPDEISSRSTTKLESLDIHGSTKNLNCSYLMELRN